MGFCPRAQHCLGLKEDLQNDPEAQMSAVTFLGPRDIRVTKKPIPKLASPTVREGAKSACTRERGAQGICSNQFLTTSAYKCEVVLTPHAMLCRMSLCTYPWPGSSAKVPPVLSQHRGVQDAVHAL